MSTKQPNPPPHGIPAGIEPKYLWCARDHAAVYFVTEPEYDFITELWCSYDDHIDFLADQPLSNYPPKNSLHRRVIENGVPTDEWEWVPNEQ
jgi:hypothetical protein